MFDTGAVCEVLVALVVLLVFPNRDPLVVFANGDVLLVFPKRDGTVGLELANRLGC